MNTDGANSASAAAADAAEQLYYHLTQQDVDSLFTLVSGAVTVELFSLLALLLILGVLMVVVFSMTIRRF